MKQTMLHNKQVLILAPLLLALAACKQADTSPSTTTSVEAAAPEAVAAASSPTSDDCAANTQIAVDFMNRYLRHLVGQEQAANPTDTYDWLKGNSLADPSLASAFAEFDLIDGDPILDAQDYPSNFKFLRCPGAPGIVEVQSVDMNLTVPVQIANQKVIGVGRVNMSPPAISTVPAAAHNSPAIGHCTSGETAAFTCSVGKKTVSVCVNGNSAQYRYGPVGAPELSYPANAAATSTNVRHGSVGFSGGDAEYIRFISGNTQYIVYSGVGRGWSKDGLVAVKDTSILNKKLCSDVAEVNLTALPGSVQEDDIDTADAIWSLVP